MNSATRENTCAIVVTFNPTRDLCDNLRRLYSIVGNNIIIVDNGSKNNYIKQLPSDIADNITTILSDENRGVGWALNQGLKYARNIKRFSYAITFDQDSLPAKNTLDLYNSVLTCYDHIGLLGTSYSDKEHVIDKVTYRQTLTLITSGLLHNLEIISSVGYYDEKLFIDSVDFDYALRVCLKGYYCFRINEPLLLHHLGNPIKRFGISSTNHSAKRRYYMAKNDIILTKRYWRAFPLWIIKKNYFFIIQICKILIVENSKRQKIKAIIQGVKDAIRE